MNNGLTQDKRQDLRLREALPVRLRFFDGKEGVLNVYLDHVEVSKPYEMLSFSNTAELMKFITPEFRKNKSDC